MLRVISCRRFTFVAKGASTTARDCNSTPKGQQERALRSAAAKEKEKRPERTARSHSIISAASAHRVPFTIELVDIDNSSCISAGSRESGSMRDVIGCSWACVILVSLSAMR